MHEVESGAGLGFCFTALESSLAGLETLMREAEKTSQRVEIEHYEGPAGGWGSLKSVSKMILREHPHAGVVLTLKRQNKPLHRIGVTEGPMAYKGVPARIVL